MAFYAAYHRHPMNRASHFVGVPVIVFSIMGLLDLARFTDLTLWVYPLSLALVVSVLVLLYYYVLDVPLALFMTVLFGAMLFGVVALREALPSTATVAWVHVGLFVGGWILQLLGHGVWEKRKPALVDNLFQVFVAPLFLATEFFFAIGLRRKTHERVEALMEAHLPARPS